MMEKQETPQHKVFLRAFVYREGSAVAVDCIVRELSDIGARLKFSSPKGFAGFLDLHIPIRGQSFHSKVQWSEGDEVGVAFHATTSTATVEIDLDRRVDRLESEIAMLKKVVKQLQKCTEPKPEAA
jgi:hypothetical protein